MLNQFITIERNTETFYSLEQTRPKQNTFI